MAHSKALCTCHLSPAQQDICPFTPSPTCLMICSRISPLQERVMTRTIAKTQRARARKKDDTRWLVGSIVVAVAIVAVLVGVNLFVSTSPAAAPTLSSGHLWGSAS